MNKSEKKKSNRIKIKKEKLILSYLWIIISIFGIFFYRFIIVDGFSFLVSIIYLILGVSLTILHLKGKLTSLKVRNDGFLYLIASILGYLLGVLHFLIFIVNPYEDTLWLIISLGWSIISVYYTLIYVKLREI
jgi:hypothetical protein